MKERTGSGPGSPVSGQQSPPVLALMRINGDSGRTGDNSRFAEQLSLAGALPQLFSQMEYDMKQTSISRLAAIAALLASAGAQAVPAIPEDSGWSGHVNLGLGAGSSESNLLAGVSSIDLGEEKISSLENSPGSEDFILPVAQFEVAYTLGENRTQFYLGNQSADAISLDLETTLRTHLGLRQEIPGVARVQISLSASPLPLDVWKDPYVVDARRSETERTAAGLHFAFDELFGTAFELSWSTTEIELDDEDSGVDLGLSRAEQRSLRREGQVYNLELSYDWQINERHQLVPLLGWVDHDLDGAAMAEDGIALSLKHVYDQGRWLLVSRAFYHDLESDDRNPIYGKQGEAELLGAAVTAFYRKPFGLERWMANATVGYQDRNSNIDFYDASFGLVSFGMFYRF